MASSARLPPSRLLRSPRILISTLQPSQPCPRRSPYPRPLHPKPFSTSSHLQGRTAAQPRNKSASSQPSIRARIAAERRKAEAAAEARGDALDYLGVVEGTLVMPRTAPALPAWRAGSFAARWALERKRLTTRVLDFGRALFSGYFQVRPRVRLWRNRRRATAFAAETYRLLNAGFATGEIGAGLDERLAPGLKANLQRRIAARKKGEGLEWRLENAGRYLETPVLESWKFMLLPEEVKGTPKDRKSGVLQAVVRLASRQSVVRTQRGEDGVVRVVDGNGRVLRGAEEIARERDSGTKDVVEYLVVQRLLKKGRLEPWKAWGMTQESSLESLAADDAAVQEKLEQYQRMRQARKEAANA